MPLTPEISKAQIISLAFNQLGQNESNSLTVVNPIYDRALAIYENMVIPDLLSCGDWKFAKTYASLSRLTAAPLNTDWAYSYQLPTIPSPVREVLRTFPMTGYEIVGKQLWTNVLEIAIYYTYKPDEQYFPDYFVVLAVNKLTAVIAPFVTRDFKIAQFWQGEANKSFAKAKAIDSQLQPNPVIQNDHFISAHNV